MRSGGSFSWNRREQGASTGSIGKVLPRQESAEKRGARETTGQRGDLHSPSASVFRLPQLVGGAAVAVADFSPSFRLLLLFGWCHSMGLL